MKRRKLLIGLGSLAAGSAAAVGSGAITSFSGEREADVPVVNDAYGMIGIQQTGSPNSQAYFVDTTEGQAAFNFGDDEDYLADGFNEGRTYIDDLFRLVNQSATPQYVWMLENGNNGGDKAVGFYTGTGPSDGTPPTAQISVGGTPPKPRDLQPLKPYDDDPVPSEGTQAVALCPGESVDVGLVVDTRPLGDGNPAPLGQLLDGVTIKSVDDRSNIPDGGGARDLDPGPAGCGNAE